MIKSIKGFNDILLQETPKWRQLETVLTQVVDQHGFEQVRLPLVEQADLFARSIGAATDIIEKEMYTLTDKSEPPTELALRPEGTAGAVRAVVEHHLLQGDNPKIWYIGPMFRYERMQKGRYRQFHQFGVESFGSDKPDVEAELIGLTAQLWQQLGLSQHLTLEINSLGESDERAAYKAALVAYLRQHVDALDADSRRRLDTNPLRILDSKVAETQALLQAAPKLSDYLGEDTQAHFAQLLRYLDVLEIPYVINPHLVRGLDYYNKTVFEWVTDKLGAQATVCAGGRYDGLIGQVSQSSSEPAAGFAIGIERLLLLLDGLGWFEPKTTADLFVVAQPDYYHAGLLLATQLRAISPVYRVKLATAVSFKAQMKKANKSGAAFALILGESELDNNQITIKHMATGEQGLVARDVFETVLTQHATMSNLGHDCDRFAPDTELVTAICELIATK